MKLKQFRVSVFRSVIDSGWINCDDVTTLVGINESGKSNILLALWKLHPVIGGEIDILHDLPVSKLSALRDNPAETKFIEAIFELNNSAKDINDELSTNFAEVDTLSLARYYDGSYKYYFTDENAQKSIDKLKKEKKHKNGEMQPGLSDADILNVLLQYIPTFVYYSNYGNLTSRIYLPNAIKWLNGESVAGFDQKEDQVRTIRVLFDYVNLKPQEILELGLDAVDIARRRGENKLPTKEEVQKAQDDKERRSLLLQSASTKLTHEFRQWWKQGEYKFRFSADGDYFYIWVSDDRRVEEVDLGLRSTGLQWFLSFYLVFLMECQSNHKDSILLLDEAGLTLHPIAQRDLAKFFNKLAENNQIINTTHSPFIIDPANIDRCRVVYLDADGGTVVSENLREGSGDVGEKSIYAVHAALGLTVSDVMLQGCQVVVVEGVSDQFYLSAIKNVLIREQRYAPKREIVFAPAGGVRGVAGISSLISAKASEPPMVILDSDKSGNDFKKKLESSLYQDCQDRIIMADCITGKQQSEIEDFVPYVLIARAVEKLLGVQDEEDEFEPEEEKPLIPQIEEYAAERDIILSKGWKVEVARAFKKTVSITGKKKKEIPEQYINMWIELFKKLENEQ